MATRDLETDRPVEVHEEYVEQRADGERHERVDVVRNRGDVVRQRVTQNVGAEQRATVAKLAQVIWLLVGILEVMLGLRIVLLLIGANAANPFAQFVYGMTDVFLWPFQGLTGSPSAGNMVLEIPTFFAMIVYALIGWVLVKLLYLVFSPTSSRSVSVYERDID
ncbi:MAG: YggT family protein [Candidatus Promineifilaceae bacterium]